MGVYSVLYGMCIRFCSLIVCSVYVISCTVVVWLTKIISSALNTHGSLHFFLSVSSAQVSLWHTWWAREPAAGQVDTANKTPRVSVSVENYPHRCGIFESSLNSLFTPAITSTGSLILFWQALKKNRKISWLSLVAPAHLVVVVAVIAFEWGHCTWWSSTFLWGSAAIAVCVQVWWNELHTDCTHRVCCSM